MAWRRLVSLPRTASAAFSARLESPAASKCFPANTTRFLSNSPAPSPDLPSVVDMKYGEKVPSIFSHDEYERRLAALRGHMDSEEIGVCVLTSYHNISYYSGFLYCAFGRPYALVVTPDNCYVVSAAIDGGQPWRRCHADNLTFTDWQKNNYLKAVKQAAGEIGGKVGIEFDHVTLDSRQKFESLFPNKVFEDVGTPTMRLRMVKSAEEIKVIKEGARIADMGGWAAVEALEDNIPEYEVALASTRAMIREIAKTFPNSELQDTWTWFQSGINTDGAHNPVTSRRVQKGDILSLNCFPMTSGYYTALERTLFFDHVTEEHLRLWEINVEVHERGLQLIRPGARCCDIAAELNDIYRQYDLLKYRSFGYGHSFGVLCHYYGREAELELREDITTVLKPDMVVSMEPMIMLPPHLAGAGGYREHDILVVTEDGAENITGFPYGPKHNIIKK